MDINRKLIKYNVTKGRAGQTIKYIVIHDTWNKQEGATAEAHYRYFNGGNRNASAHYFVDEKEIVQIIEDSDTAWHCGDNQNYLNGGGTLKNIAKNSNSIGIEICVNDGDYTKEIKDTIELVAILMKKYNVPITNVVRHFDVSGKLCPDIMRANNWRMWTEFKNNLAKYVNNEVNDQIEVIFNGKLHKVKGSLVNGTNIVDFDGVKLPIRLVGETLGFKVGYDSVTKRVLME